MSVIFIEEDRLLCDECGRFDSYNTDSLSNALDKNHISCSMELINLGITVRPFHIEKTFKYDNVHIFKHLLILCSLENTFLIDLWRRAISENSFSIMAYLGSFDELWDYDVYYAVEVGNYQSVKFLITTLHRLPTYDIVQLAVECDNLCILQFLRKFAETNENFKKKMWDEDILTIAIQCGSINCVKFIVHEDSTLWKPTIVNRVYAHICKIEYHGGIWQDAIDQLNSQHLALIPSIIECVRHIQDVSLPLAFYSCPILFDNCELMHCKSCLTTNTSFIIMRQILQDYFVGRYTDIVILLISFMSTFQKCTTCGIFETFATEIHHDCCDICSTTYYCNEECRLEDWEKEHQNICGQYNGVV